MIPLHVEIENVIRIAYNKVRRLLKSLFPP